METKAYRMKMAVLIIIASFCTKAFAGDLPKASVGDLTVLKIYAEDQRAAVRTPDGKTEMIRVGDAIGSGGRVVEIATGRIVIEERTKRGLETAIIRFEDGKQTVERIRKLGDGRPSLYAPK